MYPLIQKRLLTLEFEEKFSRYVSFVCKSKIDVQFWRWRKNGKSWKRIVLCWAGVDVASPHSSISQVKYGRCCYFIYPDRSSLFNSISYLVFFDFWHFVTVCNFPQILLHHFLPICTIGCHVNRHSRSEICFCKNCYKMKGKNLVWNRVWIPWIEAVNGSNSLKKFVQLSEEKSWETWEKSLCLWPRQQKCIQNAPSLRSNFTKINRCVAHKVTKNIYTFKSINLRIQKS